MNCAEFEIWLADYLDGTLEDAERAAVEQHAASCAGCRELLSDASSAVSFLRRAEDVTPPPELITRIAFQVPKGRTKGPFERQGLLKSWTSKWLQPMLQPRLAMGMAMTILSFAMLEKCTGVHVQHIQPADLNPVRIWGGLEDKTMRVKDRAVKYYENLRWVYEIETRLRTLQDQPQTPPSDSAGRTNAGAGAAQHGNTENRGAKTPDRGNQK